MNLFKFVWEVHNGGYEWEYSGDNPQLYSKIRAQEKLGKAAPEWLKKRPAGFYLDRTLIPAAPDQGTRTYEPLEDNTLFRTFAYTDPTAEGILSFVNRYGPLNRSFRGKFDRLKDWHDDIALMRLAIEFWDLARTANTKAISKHLQWKGNAVVGEWTLPWYENRFRILIHESNEPNSIWSLLGKSTSVRLAKDISVNVSSEVWEQIRHGDLIKPAMCVVQGIVTGRSFQERPYPKLFWHKLVTRLDWFIVPTSLQSALWLQFMDAIAGNKDYERCATCNSWFVTTPGARGKGKMYCSDACKSKAWRRGLTNTPKRKRRTKK